MKILNTILRPGWLGLGFGILLLLRDSIMLWAFSFGYYRDSVTYMTMARELFVRGGPFSNGVVNLPYPLINWLSVSWINPVRLVTVQILIGAVAAGFLIYVIATRNRALACLTGLLLLLDLTWGAVNRNVMTEALFISLALGVIAFLLWHYDRRMSVGVRELFFVGVYDAFALAVRPSGFILALLLPFVYLLITRSWKKAGALLSGIALIWLMLGVFNAWSSGAFHLNARSGFYTVSPLFVYRLFSPENGPASAEIDRMLSTCYPGENYSGWVTERAAEAQNIEIYFDRFYPCFAASGYAQEYIYRLVSSAYSEGIFAAPLRFVKTLIREGGVVLRYDLPQILPFYLHAEKNLRCSEAPWCENIRESRYSWAKSLRIRAWHENIFSRWQQLHNELVRGMRSTGWFGEVNLALPAFTIQIMFLLIAAQPRERFLSGVVAGFIGYTVLSIVAGYGFVPRYASVLGSFYSILAGLTIYVFFQVVLKILRRLLAKDP